MSWEGRIISAAERRRSPRAAAAHPVLIFDEHGRQLSRGRAANICQNGLLVVTDARGIMQGIEQVIVELSLPMPSGGQGRRLEHRRVRYLCRIIRRQQLGKLLGLGLELVRKLD